MKNKIFDKSAKLFCQAIAYKVERATLHDLASEQLTQVQLLCIRFVDRHGEPSVGAIADGLGISDAASAKLVDRLVRKKLLSRTEDPVDRRVLQIKLTNEGKKVIRRIGAAEAAHLQEILARMNRVDRDALEQGMNAFLKAALLTTAEIDEICLRCGVDHLAECPGNLLYRGMTGHNKKEV